MDAPTAALITTLVIVDIITVTGAARAIIRKVRS